MKRVSSSKIPSLETAAQNVGLIADNTWTYDNCFENDFKQKNIDLWIQYKEVEELAKSISNISTVRTKIPQSRLADYGNFIYNRNDESAYKCSVLNDDQNGYPEPSCSFEYWSKEVEYLFKCLNLPVLARSQNPDSKTDSTQRLSEIPETECGSASSKRWLASLPWPSLLIKNFPGLPDIISDGNSIFDKDKLRKRTKSDIRKFPPPHYSMKTSGEFQLHMTVTSKKVKEIWETFPISTGKSLEDIFKLPSHFHETSVELDCDIPEFYPRSWQISSKCPPSSLAEFGTIPQAAGLLERNRSPVIQPVPLHLPMGTRYGNIPTSILNSIERKFEPHDLIQMVKYSGWPVIDARVLGEMNASVAGFYPEREELFCDMIAVVDTVYNFIEDESIIQTDLEENQLACFPGSQSEVYQSRDEENTFAQLEQEAIEQYSDEIINKKFQDLEKEAQEQYMAEAMEDSDDQEIKSPAQRAGEGRGGPGDGRADLVPPNNAKARGNLTKVGLIEKMNDNSTTNDKNIKLLKRLNQDTKHSKDDIESYYGEISSEKNIHKNKISRHFLVK